MTRDRLLKGMAVSGPLALLSLIALFLFGGCDGMQSQRHQSQHSLDGWTVIYADSTTIYYNCNGNKRGCAHMGSKTIYCSRDDYQACGHELRHIAEGNYHGN